MGGRRQVVVIVVVLALAAAAGFVWARMGLHVPLPAAESSARGQALLDAVVREVRTRYILRSVDESTLYDGAGKGVLAAAERTGGKACSQLIGSSPAASSPDRRGRVALLVAEATQHCTAPRPDARRLYFGAASGMLEALGDPYTRFMDPQSFDMFKQDAQGFFFGIGILIDLKDKHLIVVQPLPGTPAARAGLHAGDRITEIEGLATTEMPLQEAVGRIRGPKGTPVHLVIQRSDQSFPVTIVRDRIEITAGEAVESLDDATRAQLRDARIGYIKLVTFNENTETAFERLLAQAQQSGARALIVDLRNNGGGLLEVSLRVADWFVPAGKPIVHTVDRNGRRETEWATRRAKLKMPVIVLVNEYTASASEIVSGALQDHHVATLVGVKTFGKGVIQQVVDLPLGSGAAITTAKYLTPSGRDIHGKGLQPDEVVGTTDEAVIKSLQDRAKSSGTTLPDSAIEQQLQQMRAAQMTRAIELLKKKLMHSLWPRPLIPRAVRAAAA